MTPYTTHFTIDHTSEANIIPDFRSTHNHAYFAFELKKAIRPSSPQQEAGSTAYPLASPPQQMPKD
jgi:hypothetical protein